MKRWMLCALLLGAAAMSSYAEDTVTPPTKPDTKKAAPKKPAAKKPAPPKKPAAKPAPAATAPAGPPNVTVYRSSQKMPPTLRDKDGNLIPTSPDAYDVSSARK